MRKFLMLLVVLVFGYFAWLVSAHDIVHPVEISSKTKKDSARQVYLDSVVNQAVAESREKYFVPIDSFLYYYGINQDYARKQDRAEADYYRTGNEKYRRLFYKYQNLKIESARKAAKFQDSVYAAK